MAYYLARHEGAVYANGELYFTAIAGGERSFMRMLAEGAVTGKQIFDQIWYPVTEEQEARCREFVPQEQDLDAAFSNIAKAGQREAGRTITIPRGFAPDLREHRGFRFMRIRDFYRPDKYRLLPQLAAVRVGSSSYVAVGAVSTAAERPIVIDINE
jgi:hypothetical protein